MQDKKMNIRKIGFALMVMALSSCFSTKPMDTGALGLILEVDESAKFVDSLPTRVTILDDFNQRIELKKFDRINNTDENIGVAILDSARNAGLDLNQLEPRRVKTQTVTGSYLLGKGELVGGFIGDGSSYGYFVRIKFKPDFVSDAENVMESIKYKKE